MTKKETVLRPTWFYWYWQLSYSFDYVRFLIPAILIGIFIIFYLAPGWIGIMFVVVYILPVIIILIFLILHFTTDAFKRKIIITRDELIDLAKRGKQIYQLDSIQNYQIKVNDSLLNKVNLGFEAWLFNAKRQSLLLYDSQGKELGSIDLFCFKKETVEYILNLFKIK